MTINGIPSSLVPSGSSPIFTDETIPGALQQEHRLAKGTWGVLHVLGGKIRFVDLEPFQERVISAPHHVAIQPEAPHRVAIEGPVEFRIDFFREPHGDPDAGSTT